MLAVVTLAAVGSWGYWVAWPWWQAYREQVDFETALQKLQRSDVDTSVLPKNQNDMMQSTVRVSTLDKVGKFIRTNASDCIVLKDRHAPSWPHACESISVYRLPHAPHDYKPYHERDLSEFDHPATSWVREIKYVDDIADFILGDAQDGRRYQYELIYSDPPAKAAAQ